MSNEQFTITIEVVPPAGGSPGKLLEELQEIASLPFDSFNVATNPVAKPRMGALTFAVLLQNQVNKPTIFHCTTRDQNQLHLQSVLWAGKAAGLSSVLVATGDMVPLAQRKQVSTVGDVSVFELIRMAGNSGFTVGIVLNPHPENRGKDSEYDRLSRKREAGADYCITQPVYTAEDIGEIHSRTGSLDIPIYIGILPLRTDRHARFLEEKVSGIHVPQHIIRRMEKAEDQVAEGVRIAGELLAECRDTVRGVCIMPPFNHFEILEDLL
jgi:homocysteine S-methyltransferase